MNGKISVAMPVFNRAEWVGQTLDHIFSQTVSVDEVVLCDDGSTDNLEAALEPFRDRITLVRIDNSGPAIARKTAIEHASGDWIALCDSDDFWESHHIETFIRAQRLYPECDFYFCDFKQSDQEGTTKFQQSPENWLTDFAQKPVTRDDSFLESRQSLIKSLLDYQACFQSCLIFRKALYEKVGGIKPYVSRWRSEDLHLTARMAAQAKAVIGLEPTVMINKHSDNFSSEYIKNLKGEVDILMDILDQKLVPQRSLDVISEQLINFKRKLFRAHYWSGQYGEAVVVARQLPSGCLKARDSVRLTISRGFCMWRRA